MDIQTVANILTEDISIPYRPELKRAIGSTNASILLQQILHCCKRKNWKPFYKFNGPCDHELYRSGDSWEEELAFTYKELSKARDVIGVKKTQDMSMEDAGALALEQTKPVIYWTDAGRVTHYMIFAPALEKLLEKCYFTKGELGGEIANSYFTKGQLPILPKVNYLIDQRENRNTDITRDNNRNSDASPSANSGDQEFEELFPKNSNSTLQDSGLKDALKNGTPPPVQALADATGLTAIQNQERASIADPQSVNRSGAVDIILPAWAEHLGVSEDGVPASHVDGLRRLVPELGEREFVEGVKRLLSRDAGDNPSFHWKTYSNPYQDSFKNDLRVCVGQVQREEEDGRRRRQQQQQQHKDLMAKVDLPPQWAHLAVATH